MNLFSEYITFRTIPSEHIYVLNRSKFGLQWTSHLGPEMGPLATFFDVHITGPKDVHILGPKDVLFIGPKDVHILGPKDVLFIGPKDVLFIGLKDVQFLGSKDVQFLGPKNVHIIGQKDIHFLRHIQTFKNIRVTLYVRLLLDLIRFM